MTMTMPKTDHTARKPRASRTQAALDRLAEAQAATQAELHDLVGQVRYLTERVGDLADAQRRTESTLEQLIRRVGYVESDTDRLIGRDLERHYREHATSFFQRILRDISVPDHAELDGLAGQAERRGVITIDEHQDIGLADVIIRGISRTDDQDSYLVAEVSRSVGDRDVVRAQRRAAIVARITGLPTLAAVCGERIRPDADSSARAAGLWRVLDGVTLAPTDAVPTDRLATTE